MASLHSLLIAGKRPSPLSGHLVPQRLEGGHSKDILLQTDHHAKLAQPLKNQAQMKLMCLEVKTGDPEVIQIAVGKMVAGQYLVHCLLKAAACIAKTKRHPLKL